MLDYLYGVLVACAALLAVLLVSSLAFYAVRGLRERRERNTKWMPATRRVGNQTWIVVQLIHHNWAGERILAEQLIGAIPNNLSDYAHQLARSERIAELRAAWLNHGEPETPTI